MEAWQQQSTAWKCLTVLFALLGLLEIVATLQHLIGGRLFVRPGLLFLLAAYGLFQADGWGHALARLVAWFYVLMTALIASIALLGPINLGERRIEATRVELPLLGIEAGLQTPAGQILGLVLAAIVVGLSVGALLLRRASPVYQR